MRIWWLTFHRLLNKHRLVGPDDVPFSAAQLHTFCPAMKAVSNASVAPTAYQKNNPQGLGKYVVMKPYLITWESCVMIGNLKGFFPTNHTFW